MMLPIVMALAQFAPMIAGLISGPKAEEIAGKVVNVAQAVTGAATPDAALAALQANPDLALEFQKALVEKEVELAQIAADVRKAEIAADAQSEQTAAGDRDSARKREAAVRDNTPRVLAYLLIGGFLGMAFAVLFGQVRADTVLAGTIIGYLSAKAEQIVAYYFGSTAGSAKKSELLAQAGKPPA
ncbi:hypothetical protein [Cupriavidus phytorum]|nr:hypothetical protein [Cupriavidus alkaliphilus]